MATDDRLARAQQRLAGARARLAQVAVEGDVPDMRDITDAVLNVAQALGALRATWLLTEGGGTADDLVQALLQAPADTFSGRGNDIRRAEHDGYRSAASTFLRRH